MQLYNLNDHSQQVSFTEAVKMGLGRKQGVFFPKSILPLANVEQLLAQDFVTRSSHILHHLLEGEIDKAQLEKIVKNAFTFDAPLVKVAENLYCLELFHGPTLAFKDFGGRFMAKCLAHINQGEKTTILTATSGDTGAAVAHAFYGAKNIDVVILYPEGKISEAQQKLFTTLGGNIHCYSVKGSFDDCQALVKAAFLDDEVKSRIGLNSANSINISRLLAQVCYYFEAVAQLEKSQRDKVHISVPSGNFGNVCAAMIASLLGLPVQKLSATTNQNDTVPRFLQTKQWQPNLTKESISNAMDVSRPNNWPRVQTMLDNNSFSYADFYSQSINEQQTQHAMQALQQLGYQSEPHTAIAYQGLVESARDDEQKIFLATAHPAKFQDTVEQVLGCKITLPKPLQDALEQPCLAKPLANDYPLLREELLKL